MQVVHVRTAVCVDSVAESTHVTVPRDTLESTVRQVGQSFEKCPQCRMYA